MKSVVEGLSIGDGEFLIAVIWITARGRHYHSLYPFANGYDVKYRTNSEKRPLIRGCAKHPDGRNLPTVNGFLPSEAR